VTKEPIKKFRKRIYDYYRTRGRDLPWRKTEDPYAILVSEIMLQQTQVERVRVKYVEFLKAFPTVEALAAASFRRVLLLWQGLGYNRRARALKMLAEEVVRTHNGKIPASEVGLCALPGIGKATAAAILAYAFNKEAVFIETNVRAVFIHFFFKGKADVIDASLALFVAETLDRQNPGRWYHALMDYGAFLKKKYPELLGRSAHYKKQAPFKGSRRLVRGAILKLLAGQSGLTTLRIARSLGKEPDLVRNVLDELCAEKFLVRKERRYSIAEHVV
jgi:A/G-specific adenine glycosylase